MGEHPVIKSFRDKETEGIFKREGSRKLPPEIQQRAYRKLVMLDSAGTLGDLAAAPGNNLEKLPEKPGRPHSIRINNQWRLCFRWEGRDAYDVWITDYH